MKKIEIEINGKINEYQIPESWSDITVKQFSKLQSVDEKLTDLEKVVEIVSIMCGIDKSIILKMKSSQLQEINNSINFYLNHNDLNSEKEQSIVIGGEEYFFNTDITDFTVAEEMSINTLVEQFGNNILHGFPDFLCIFLRKKTNGKLEEFEPEFMNRKSLFETISIQKVFSHIVFFSKLEKR